MNRPRISWEALSADLVAGIVVGVLMVPQGMAYALLAGLPPTSGLYACMVAPFVYAAVGTSRPLSVGPVAVVSLMTSAALGPLVPGGSPEYIGAALTVALLSGVLLGVLGVLRLGVLANFLSYPVIAGFTMGAALVIILSQTPLIMGVKVKESADAAGQFMAILAVAGNAKPLTLAIGLTSVAALLAARGPLAGWLKRLGMRAAIATGIARTMPLTVVVISVFAALNFPLKEHGVVLVGPLAQGFPSLKLPDVRPEQLRILIGPAALIALIGYVESVSIGQLLARRRRERIDTNRELGALGLANLATAISGGMPVAGSISRSAENDLAGAQTRMSGLFAALVVLSTALFLGGLLQNLPRVVLAAVIVAAVVRLLAPRALLRIWRYNRADGLAWIGTTLGVLVLGVERGLVAGLVLSLLFYVWRTANPHVVEVGRVPYSDLFVEAERHHDVDLWPQLLLIRIDESLFFGNAAAVETFVGERVSQRPDVTDVILIFSAVNGIDASAYEMLESLVDRLEQTGITLHLAELKGPVMDQLSHAGLLERLGRGRIHPSAASAVVALASPPI